jgi:hypothetical protein
MIRRITVINNPLNIIGSSTKKGSRGISGGGKLWKIKIILISLHKKRDARE